VEGARAHETYLGVRPGFERPRTSLNATRGRRTQQRCASTASSPAARRRPCS